MEWNTCGGVENDSNLFGQRQRLHLTGLLISFTPPENRERQSNSGGVAVLKDGNVSNSATTRKMDCWLEKPLSSQ